MTMEEFHDQALDSFRSLILPILAALFTTIGTLYVLTEDIRIKVSTIETRQSNGLERLGKTELECSRVSEAMFRQSDNVSRISKLEDYNIIVRDYISKDILDRDKLDVFSGRLDKVEHENYSLDYRIGAVEKAVTLAPKH